ncbi:MBL fold metallo-hydrolase [Thiohalorhabdus sp.]|uniref:MBL fold metallo-hydrolase n=1 Tax=Thiohalorhabdus sp. TaxID=3094134 RepID=UPI002FC2867C
MPFPRMLYPLMVLLLAAGVPLVGSPGAQAGDDFGPLELEEVADGVYALIGPTGPRRADNHALNANFGFVVSGDGVAVIDSGASPAGADLIHEAVRRVTDQPVRWVLNTGSQDHRWLGNSYFKQRGATIHALAATTGTQKRFADRHRERLKGTLDAEEAAAIDPVRAAEPHSGDRARLELGGRVLELRRFGDAHFPGDAVVWLPEAQVLFGGDHIYVDRMLGIHPFSDVQQWQEAFHAAMDLGPERIVPGHGGVAAPAKAQAQTGDYLDWLVEEVGQAVEKWEPLSQVTDRLTKAAPEKFKALRHFDNWHPTNVSRTYTQLEADL